NVSTGTQPVLATTPESRTVAPGQGLELSVTASGPGPFQYQWFHDGRVVTGGTNSVLKLLSFEPLDSGTYYVRVTSVFGVASSPSAEVLPESPLRLDAIQFSRTAGSTLRLAGQANTFYITETSTNLINWQPLSTNSSST